MKPLEIANLSVRYGTRVVLDDVSLTVGAGEIVALVGPSGSGKSTLIAAALNLLPGDAVEQGAVRIAGADLTTLDEASLRALRGGRVGIVFQEPATALNPALTIGRQIGEVLEQHSDLDRRAIARQVDALLGQVGLDLSPKRYPHSLSGGQRQRVAIAMAIAAGPALLLADEPTASLDPFAQAEIAGLLQRLVRERAMGLLLVTHDEALAARIADRVVALDQGRIVAARTHRDAPPLHANRLGTEASLRFEAVTRRYAGQPHDGAALREASFTLRRGETLAVIGASGSGKSTLARLALGLNRPDAGRITIDGIDWQQARGTTLRALRRRVQAVFQDPAASFDPRQTVAQIVGEPLYLAGPISAFERRRRVAEALAQVGLPEDAATRLPQAFSGGQRQRIAIARALILQPDLIVLDEALSALDPATRAEIMALLIGLQRDRGLSYLLIAHDMDLVRQMADRVIILDKGRIVTDGAVAEVLQRIEDENLRSRGSAPA